MGGWFLLRKWLDDPEKLEDSTEIVSYGTSDLSLFLNAVKSDPTHSRVDVAALEVALGAQSVRYVSLKATDLVHVGISTGVIQERSKGSPCEQALMTNRNYMVADAIGATTLTYDFLDANRRALTSKVSALASVLFKLGLSKSTTTIGTASFAHPVFIGFTVVRYDGRQFVLR